MKASYLHFDDEGYPWKPDIDYRLHPELYRVGECEQGVLICEPYKSEIGRYRRIKRQVSQQQAAIKFMSFLCA